MDEEVEGVSEKELAGVRILVGVRNPSASLNPRVDGVCGNGIEFLEGVAVRLEGVMGNGTANSPTVRFVGDFEGDFENGEGEEGVARMEAAEGDFGEDEARRRVSVEGCFATGRAGRVAIGIGGTSRVSL
jgi:hypothetical protein